VSSGSALESGFAPKLLLVSLVYMMLAGGIAKLRNGGRAWLKGRALRFYIEESVEFARSPWVSRMLRASPRLCSVLATVSVVVEMSGILALLDVRFTPLVVLAWVCLHIGILLVMMPAYWVQMWCYLLLIDWYTAFGLGSPHRWTATDSDGPAVTMLTAFYWLYCLILIIVFLRHSEEWPFTSVPMYSNGTSPAERKLPAPSELHARAVAAQRGEVTAWHRPWVSTEVDEDILIVPADGRPAMSLFEVLSEHGVTLARWSQWAKVVRGIAIADVAAKPADRPEESGPDFPATRFLRQLVLLLRERLPIATDHVRLDLVCHTADGPLVIGSANLASEQTVP
jgi:hypothetical protein